MEITVERASDHVICRPVGEIEAHNVDEVRRGFGSLTGEQLVVLDLSEVTFIDSAGLGCLIGMVRRVRGVGGDVSVVSTRGHLTRILSTTGFDRIVPVEGSVSEALAAVRRGL
jgi:anti-sigma B factor antagonist